MLDNSNEEKIKELYTMLHKYLIVALKDESLTQDFVQETLYKYLKSNIDFSDSLYERSWLLTVATNLCKNHWRSTWYKKVIPLSDKNDLIYSYTPESNFIEKENHEKSFSEVMKLPYKYREVIHLFYYEGLDIAEISKIVGRNKSTIQTQIHRARNMIKERMGVQYEL